MKYSGTLACLIFLSVIACAQVKFNIDLSKKGPEIQPDMYGVFFEDINFGADGGLYAELVKNRSFDFHQPFTGWTAFGDVTIRTENPAFERNPNYMRMTEKGLRRGTGLENEGFRKMGFKQNALYNFSFFARSDSESTLKFRIELISSTEEVIGRDTLRVQGNAWKKYAVSLRSSITDPKGKIRLILETPGTVDVDHVSLFPADTWKNRENGLRKDLVETLYDLRPKVFRFPGGCIIEGNTLETRYQWKNSVGPVENRPVNENRWNYTFKHRFFPDYYQTYGLGFYEFFLLSEDLGAEPLPVVSCGLACQYESTECVLVSDLQPYIDDALDLIEFANGPADSEWGKVRAQMGHPRPFNLKYIAIGNEQWGELYVERLIPFIEAIRKKYPEIKIIGSSGPAPDGEHFDYLWPKMKELNVELVDEHYYRSPEWYLENAGRYDNYDRTGPKVFAGEYAAHHRSRANNAAAALAEAAFMTGLERNADVVHLATYAPLLAHVDAWQWRPDLIWFDNLEVVRTPNYYVQQMFSRNSGTNIVPVKMDGMNITGQNGLYASASLIGATSELIVKVVNTSQNAQTINIRLNGLKTTLQNKKVEVVTLHSTTPEAVNTLEKPNNVVPTGSFVVAGNDSFTLQTQPNAFYVCRIVIK